MLNILPRRGMCGSNNISKGIIKEGRLKLRFHQIPWQSPALGVSPIPPLLERTSGKQLWEKARSKAGRGGPARLAGEGRVPARFGSGCGQRVGPRVLRVHGCSTTYAIERGQRPGFKAFPSFQKCPGRAAGLCDVCSHPDTSQTRLQPPSLPSSQHRRCFVLFQAGGRGACIYPASLMHLKLN